MEATRWESMRARYLPTACVQYSTRCCNKGCRFSGSVGDPGGRTQWCANLQRDRGCPVATGPPSRALHLNEIKAVIHEENGSRHRDTDRPKASNLAGGEKRQARERARNWPLSRLPMRECAPKDVSTEDTSATDIR